jgi:hypothetical protein
MASKSDPGTYTKPDLRDKIKDQVVKSDKGGNPGQWSARKAQLVTQEYEKEGGGYKKPRNEKQQSLKKWGDEHWQTDDGSARARVGGKTKRYLPKQAWEKLSAAEKKATEEKKERGSRQGKQFVANTPAAASARKKAVAKKSAGKKAAAKKVVSKRGPAKKTAARKTPAKKAAKKTAAKRAASKTTAKRSK